MYPNPTQHIVSIEYVDMKNKRSRSTLNIFTSEGKQVFSHQLSVGQTKFELNVENWAKGGYWVQWLQDGVSITENLIIY